MCVASGCYLDGRAAHSPEILMTEKPPLGRDLYPYLNWRICENPDGSVSLCCKCNGYFLDGRAEPGHIAFATNRDPTGDAYLQWRIEKLA